MKKLNYLGMILCGLLVVSGPAIAQNQMEGEDEVQLIKGLDGGLYEPYLPSVVEEVQTALTNEGLYQGEIDGVLDNETMEAIAEYQKQHGIMISGVPSPETRESLLGEESA